MLKLLQRFVNWRIASAYKAKIAKLGNLPALTPDVFEMTIEQQLEFNLMSRAMATASREQLIEMAQGATKLYFYQLNVCRKMLKGDANA